MKTIASLFLYALLACTSHARDFVAIDGDTIRHGQLRLRLAGVDAPELPTTKGIQAKRFLQNIIAKYPVTCIEIGMDKYQRLLVNCHFIRNGSKVSLDNELISNGMARRWQ